MPGDEHSEEGRPTDQQRSSSVPVGPAPRKRPQHQRRHAECPNRKPDPRRARTERARREEPGDAAQHACCREGREIRGSRTGQRGSEQPIPRFSHHRTLSPDEGHESHVRCRGPPRRASLLRAIRGSPCTSPPRWVVAEPARVTRGPKRTAVFVKGGSSGVEDIMLGVGLGRSPRPWPLNKRTKTDMTIRDRTAATKRVPTTPLRKTALVAGILYLVTFISIPT